MTYRLISLRIASLLPDGDSLFALTTNGVWSTADGGAFWQPYDSTGWRYPMSFEMMQMGTQVVDRAAWGDVFVRGAFGWIMHLDAYEQEPEDRHSGAWLSLGEQGARSARAVGDSTIVAVVAEGCLHRSTVRGVTWQLADDVLCQFELIDEVVDTLWFSAANGGMWRSTDEKASWDSIGVMAEGEGGTVALRAQRPPALRRQRARAAPLRGRREHLEAAFPCSAARSASPDEWSRPALPARPRDAVGLSESRRLVAASGGESDAR